MKTARIKNSNEKTSLKDIENFENIHNLKLSNSYKNFLLNFNGGNVEPNLFKISGAAESVVNVFYGLNISKTYDELSEVFESLDSAIPNNFLAIGDDPGGNQICLGISNENFGKIYFWFHDIEDNDKEENMIFLSDDFDNFIDRLYEDNDL